MVINSKGLAVTQTPELQRTRVPTIVGPRFMHVKSGMILADADTRQLIHGPIYLVDEGGRHYEPERQRRVSRKGGRHSRHIEWPAVP